MKIHNNSAIISIFRNRKRMSKMNTSSLSRHAELSKMRGLLNSLEQVKPELVIIFLKHGVVANIHQLNRKELVIS